jgi:hypothetical protein
VRLAALVLALGLLACGSSEPVAERSSPLLAMDSDRLWVLLQAAKINPRCRELYEGSTDPRVTGLAEKCGESELRVVAWLHANEMVDARIEDLREPAFWQWYSGKLKTLDACRAPLDPDSRSYWKEFNACDPYERIMRVEKKSLADAGYRAPGD